MACKTESKVIGDHEYSVTQWPAERAMTTKFRVLKIVGPAIASLSNANEEAGIEALEHGLQLLFSSASPEEMVALIKECVVGVACDGTRITQSSFTEMFSGDSLMEVYQVFLFVLQVNYGNFLRGPLVAKVLAKMDQQ